MKRRTFVESLLVSGVVVAVVAMSMPQAWALIPTIPGPPTLDHAVVPTLTSGTITSCPTGSTTFIDTSGLKDGDVNATYSNGGTTFAATIHFNGTHISFTANAPSFTVYIEGRGNGAAPAYDTFAYLGTLTSPVYPEDKQLHAPYMQESPTKSNLMAIDYYLVCGKATPTLSTAASPGGGIGSVVLNDQATLAGGASPTGSITFNLYGPSDPTCSSTPA
jgi:hypothetical protein